MSQVNIPKYQKQKRTFLKNKKKSSIPRPNNGLKTLKNDKYSKSFYSRNDHRAIPGHAHNVLSGVEAMWKRKVLCDVIIHVGGKRFQAHRVILSACSEYFHRFFSESSLSKTQLMDGEVKLEGVSADTMETIIDCMYTGKINISESTVREILSASAFLKFFSVEDACGEFLRNNLTVSNCLRMLNIAFNYNLGDLANDALQMIARNFMDVMQGFDFHQLDVDQLLAILSRDDVSAESELEVFKRALKWIEFDYKGRHKFAGDMLYQIRLPLFTPSEIVDHVEAVEYLMKIPECQKLVKEALHYHCLPARQSILQNARTIPRSTYRKEAILAMGGAPRLKSSPVGTDVWHYNPDAGEWNILTKMKVPRHHHAAAVLGGFLYVAGGEETNDQRSPLNTVYRYDPRNNAWLQVADMNNRRESFQLGVLNGMLYAVGGRVDQDVSLAEVERYNPAVDKWEPVAPLSAARRSVAVASHCGRLYAMGGSGHKRISSKVERYNPMTNTWETKRPLTTPRFFAHLAPVGNKLYLCGGATLDSAGTVICVRKVETYNPNTDTWTSLSEMHQPRAEAGCAVLGNKIYIIGGYSWDEGERLSSVEYYDVDTNKWMKAASIATPYTGIAAVSLTIFSAPSATKGQTNYSTTSSDQSLSTTDESAPGTGAARNTDSFFY